MKTSSSISVHVVLLAFAALSPACGGSQPAEPAAPPPAPAPAAAAPSAAAPPPAAQPSAAAPSPAASAEATPAPAPAPEHHMGHHHGMAALFISSLDSVDLKPEQKTAIAGIEADLQKLGEQHKDTGKKLASDLADGVTAGKIDHKKTDLDIKELVKAVEGTVPGIQDAVTRVYKTLDPAQRKKLADTLHAKSEEMREHGMGMPGMGMHGEHEKGEKGEHGPGGHDDHEKGEHGMGMHEEHPMLHKLAEDLGLSPDQKEKIHAKLEAQMKTEQAAMKEKMGAAEKHMQAIGEAFAGDKFDAKKVGVGQHAPDMAKAMAGSRVTFAEIVLGILTPEQRTKFAAHLRDHAGDPD